MTKQKDYKDVKHNKSKHRMPKAFILEDKYIWYPVVYPFWKTPWGYRRDEKDEQLLIPIPKELELLEKARELKAKYSYRELANWLTEQTGKTINHTTLKARFDNERRRRIAAKTSRYYAQKYKEAAEKAEKLESQLGGSKVRIERFPSDSEASSV